MSTYRRRRRGPRVSSQWNEVARHGTFFLVSPVLPTVFCQSRNESRRSETFASFVCAATQMAARLSVALGAGWLTRSARRRATECNPPATKGNPGQQNSSRGSPQVAAQPGVIPQNSKIVFPFKLFYAVDGFPENVNKRIDFRPPPVLRCV
jgi:hypothetical protein